MITLHKLIATVFGLGYIKKGAGTIAAAVFCLIWAFIPPGCISRGWHVFAIALVSVLGVWSGNAVDSIWGKDSNKVVIDEVAGMMVTLLFIPVKLKYIVTGLVLFRFFDIAKPLFVNKMELLPKGWGVMADDLLAGIYSNILLWVIVLSEMY